MRCGRGRDDELVLRTFLRVEDLGNGISILILRDRLDVVPFRTVSKQGQWQDFGGRHRDQGRREEQR